MADLIIVTGPPGAGKSTVARALADRFAPSALVAGDEFFAFLGRGAIAPWLPAADAQNHVVTRSAASASGQFVAGGYTTVYDGVVGPWFLPTFLAASELESCHYVVLLPSVDRCVARIQARIGHGFRDNDATRHMHEQFARATLDPRHVYPDPPDDVRRVVERIMDRLASGSLRTSFET